jgi:hypothetical protein
MRHFVTPSPVFLQPLDVLLELGWWLDVCHATAAAAARCEARPLATQRYLVKGVVRQAEAILGHKLCIAKLPLWSVAADAAQEELTPAGDITNMMTARPNK